MSKTDQLMAESALGSGVARSLQMKKKKIGPRSATIVQTTAAASDPEMAKGSCDVDDSKSPKSGPLDVGKQCLVRMDDESLRE